MQIWSILQDISQLRAIYEKSAGTFLANAEITQIFKVTDFETAKLVSDMLGQKTIEYETSSESSSLKSSSSSKSQNVTSRQLMTPDEVMAMNENKLILFMASKRPVIAQKVKYYSDPEFEGLFDKG